MTVTLIGLHGFTLNGALMRTSLAPLAARFPSTVSLVCPDGPNPCSEASITRMAQLFGSATPAPHCCWFDASDDGRQYHGFDLTKDTLSQLIANSGDRVGLIGFSQGAIASASLAALSVHGKFPTLAFVVLIAGRTPRADEVTPCLDPPIAMPSLHVWGERDPFGHYADDLAMRFDASERRALSWPGPHTIPTRGDAADAIVEFITKHA